MSVHIITNIQYKILNVIKKKKMKKQLPHCNYGRYRMVHLMFPFFYRSISIIFFFYLARAHIKQPNKKMEKNTQNIMLVKLTKTTKLINNIS